MSTSTIERNEDVAETIHSKVLQCDVVVRKLEALGQVVTRYGLVAVLLWIGAMKFTSYESEAIFGFVENSPLMSWAYQLFTVGQFSALIGIVELTIGVLIACRSFSAKLSAVGSALAAGMFFTTLTFLLSTPGVVEPSLGFPALSVVPGQFLFKDTVLFGAALWTTAEALQAAKLQSTEKSECKCR